MPDTLRQDKRVGKLVTPLGPDELVLVGFECTEGVSEKFEIRIDALSNRKSIDFNPAIGQGCTVTVELEPGQKRHFNGVLAEAHTLGGDDELGHYAYRLVLRPWLWLLSYRRNSLIFHDVTVTDVIGYIVAEHGQSVEIKASRKYPSMEYCVQYRESDMDFLCRLMEQYGLSYFFRHSEGEHKLVVSDEMSTFAELGGSRRYLPNPSGHTTGAKEDFFSWAPERRFTSGQVKLDDYDFENSESDLVVTSEINPPFDPGTLEVFDYPGGYVKQGDGQKIADGWRDMERSNDGHFNATGNCVTCFPGALVTIEDKTSSGFDGEYLALRCRHRFGPQSFRSGAGDPANIYAGQYEFIRSDKAYAPPRVTRKALIHGPQTAKVVGKNEIDVDQYGRILVRFHWDQKQDQSRRCRVAHVWAGSEWGAIYTPRVGMEVVVIFLEGDPDQPLVIGCVYNDKHMPPYSQDGKERSISGVKSNSTPGGKGYNEFIFDDAAGSELVRLHAQKDLESVVEADESRKVGASRTTKIESKDTLDVGTVLKIDAGSKVEITVGSSKITMTQDKISLESTTIEINAKQFKTDAIMSQHSASGVMDIKGTLVKINS